MVRDTVVKVDDHAVEGVPTNNSKGEKIIMEPSMNSAQRRTLGDITNLPRNVTMKANQQQQSMSLSSKEYAEKLQKENMRLMKALTERNAIIQRNGSELQKYRINLQMVQVQNLQLAQTHSRILEEIRTSKDQLKALQHELSCKNGVLIARKLPLETQNLPCTDHFLSEDKGPANASGGACEAFHPEGEDHKPASESSDGNSLQINEKANNKRASLRRQSGRFNIQEMGVTKNLNGIHDDQEFAAKAGCSASCMPIVSKPEAVELHDTKEITRKSRRVSSRRQATEFKSQKATKASTDPPLHDDIVEESSKVSSSISVELKRKPKNKPRGDEAEEKRETYVGRPSRKAAVKIKSYKEVSLKEKMRRDF